jgi:hypothetical protein
MRLESDSDSGRDVRGRCDTVIEPGVIDILVPAAEPPLELPARPAGPIETTGQYSAPYYRSEGVGPGAYIIAVQSGPDECTRLAA